ncbi:MAG: VCBS repeat-containing protein, partial [Planctomycetota bacterium]
PSVEGAYYQPDVEVALPAQGSTRGGTKLTLIGRALLPLVPGRSPGEPDFDALRIQLRKGDRIVDLDPAAIVRDESSLDRLVFFVPPSPDGRPGDVGIALRVGVAAPPKPPLIAEVVARSVFRFANPEPVFGPRGALLDRDPIAVVPIALEGAPTSTQATDFAVLYSAGGAASVQLLAAQENGLFIRFGPARRIGDPEVAGERSPRDLLSGDFDRDGIPDLLVINEGAATATMHFVRGQAAPAAPLGDVQRVPGIPGMVKGRVADFDGDGGADVVLLPGPSAPPLQAPVLLRSRVQDGTLVFLPPVAVPVRDYAFDALEVADFDGDGALDVGVIAGRLLQRIDVAYGDGNGGFQGATSLNFNVPRAGYQPSAGSPAVGLHAVGAAPCALTVVLAGLPPQPFAIPPGPAEHPTTPPVIFVVRPASPRSYQQPVLADVLQLVGAIDPFRSSLAINLDGDGLGADELLVGSTGALGQFSLGLFRFEAAIGLRVVRVVVDFRPTQVAAFFVGIAFPAAPEFGQPAQAGLFVQHELSVDGELERRLSTLLVSRDSADLLLLPPDVVFPVPLAGVVGGRFSQNGLAAGGAVRDVAVPSSTQIQLGDNDGFGALAPGKKMVHAGLVPETAARVPQAKGGTDLIAFLDDGARDGRTDGALRVGLWRPDPNGSLVQAPQFFSANLRPFLPPSLRTATVDPTSHLVASDVDSDGLIDLTVLLRFFGSRLEGDAILVLLHGASTDGPDDFPFEALLPGALTPTNGGASGMVLGDFAADSNLVPVRLELAMAVPFDSLPGSGDGNHVRFYRVQGAGAGTPAAWVRSFDSPAMRSLVTGNSPTQLGAADFDGSGSVDLMVACDGDATLLVYLNSGLPSTNVDEVAIAAFTESYGSPLSTRLGRHTHLLLGDINGDGTVDALLATESTIAGGDLSTDVVFHLSTGAGEFGNGIRVSPTRLGNRNARLSIDLGDINRDAVPDLTLGWFQGGTQADNLLVLLGGSL